MDEIPDYSRCSLTELISIAAQINQEKYPDRYDAVRNEIERRGQEPLSPAELKAERNSFIGCGIFLGPFLYTLTVFLLHSLLIPSVLGDGQYGMIVFWTVPAGAVLGALIGAFLPRASQSPLLQSGWFLACDGGFLFNSWAYRLDFREFCHAAPALSSPRDVADRVGAFNQPAAPSEVVIFAPIRLVLLKLDG